MAAFAQPRYDLLLRGLCREGALKMKVVFPFATSLSRFAEGSAIQSGSDVTERLWNAFRRLAWFDRDLDQVRATLKPIEAALRDEEAELLGRIVAGHLSPKFVVK